MIALYPDLELRKQLKDRLEQVRRQRAELSDQLKRLEVAELGYARALEAEESLFGGDTPSVTVSSEDAEEDQPSQRDGLIEDLYGDTTKAFLLSTMADGQVWSLERLKGLAEERKLPKPGNSYLGRMLHGALMGMKQNGQVELIARGLWRIGKKQNAPLTNSEAF